ncbi:macro domain-containing protein [Paraburkholderia sp. J10-1]|uniref:macro domain-containing protein n=1 Tax=Paraburkholderia sp. J10-1 TaxID=2805430 RepID=UPI002AB5F64F|nr:macro domain-containing protein [Paraburkholderia sp. J10-1]
MKIIFRDLNHSGVVDHVRALLPSWDAEAGNIWNYGSQPVDIIVSPANVTGRMDGGIDQIYINRFGWQLEARLMRDIRTLHGGHLPIGSARLITTYDERADAIPLMICAPTMAWPPGDVSDTNNAYLAFRAVLRCALTDGVKALGREPTILMPGLATATGRMSGHNCARQLHAAWTEAHQHMSETKVPSTSSAAAVQKGGNDAS